MLLESSLMPQQRSTMARLLAGFTPSLRTDHLNTPVSPPHPAGTQGSVPMRCAHARPDPAPTHSRFPYGYSQTSIVHSHLPASNLLHTLIPTSRSYCARL